MFLILLNYLQPLSEVDRFVDAHRAFLERHYASGHFLISGRKQPRTGGVILARAGSRAEVEEIIREDPFHAHGIAHYEVIEFAPAMTAPELEHLKAS